MGFGCRKQVEVMRGFFSINSSEAIKSERRVAMPFINLHDLEEKELNPGFKGHIIHSVNMTVAHFHVKAGSVLPEHSHPHEQVTCILEGEFEMTVNGETEVLGAGSAAIIPSDAIHSGRAITDCRAIDAFHPVREDWR